VLAAFELSGLELGQTGADTGPELTALTLCHPFEQERQDADFHMGLDTPSGPMIHRHHLDLGAFE